jgi:DNA polymerase III delta prime subunit
MTSHHAVLLSVELPLEFEYEHAPHLIYREPQFGIDLVRTLIVAAHRRPAGDADQQLIMVATEFITEEAQQALLKIIEEPPLSTKFLFVLPQGYSLLPTLESRFERQETESGQIDQSVFQSFLTAPMAERLSTIEEAAKKKDHVWHMAMKRGLLSYIQTARTNLSYDVVRELEYVGRLLLTRGASNKFLLEHLALTLPA